MNVDHLRKRLRATADAYRRGEDQPLSGYLGSLLAYGALVAASAGMIKASHRALPARIAPFDVLLLGVATHKTSRTLTKDAVTSPIRAPFVEFEGPAGPGEVHENVTAQGTRHAVGELLTCPFCIAQWVATGYSVGLVLAPRATRLVMTTMAARAISDALQLAYAAEERVATAGAKG